MSAVDEIQAAIDKLSRLHSDEPWRLVGGNEWITPIGIGVAPDDGGVSVEDAELIVTLHRTIDAQLAILTGAMKPLTKPGYMAYFGEFVEGTFRHQLLLARAINGVMP